MTGIAIITAGREDAYQDYLHSVKGGHDPAEFDGFLSETEREAVTDQDSGCVHLWGTSVDSKWQSVEPGDIALVYRGGKYIAQATVVRTRDDLELAEHLWRTEGNPWDPENPWRYLIFLSDVEEIDAGIESFNDLVGYQDNYIPQGFSRVSDERIRRLDADFESVETAVNELTGSGVRVHEFDDEETDDDPAIGTNVELGQQLVGASHAGDRYEELEELVAKAFSRLGFEARWIVGGDDTDVEITAPIHSIVEVKARSNGTLASPDATRIAGHKDRHGADHAIVVGPGFAPAAIEDADRQDLVLLATDHLREVLARREQYGVSPEVLATYLTEPGAFQDDRLDQLDEQLRTRLSGTQDLVAVMEALQRADAREGTAENLRLILKGMYDEDRVPDEHVIEQSLNLLAHPSIQLAEYVDGQYQPTTTTANAKVALRRFGNFIDEVDAGDEEKDV
ncbi:restriction endonuclease [Haloferax volcanii]|uniref:Restriction endonuclease n=1 Tax=Haloferax volcanii TaxID=2246 RepID=A0A847TBJ6_HALVO|nr:restriction endonuclease [Haloferax alexandrinus]NLV02992.1 restriction endonuclease [Haloferax alexandrinus]